MVEAHDRKSKSVYKQYDLVNEQENKLSFITCMEKWLQPYFQFFVFFPLLKAACQAPDWMIMETHLERQVADVSMAIEIDRGQHFFVLKTYSQSSSIIAANQKCERQIYCEVSHL